MIFTDLLAGESVFVDANTLIYHFGPHPTFAGPCGQLLHRIETQDIRGFTSTHVLGEVAHQLMIIEASTLPGWAPGRTRQRLQQQPGTLQQLTRFRTAVETVLQSAIQILVITPPLLGAAATLSQQHGLLTNDALIVALMQANGLTKLASHDADFDRVPGLTRYAPA
ncbi:MAG TPA: type II toxin-antitoxin system VapC family toxin [Gemmataceae bacterium]|jgi:predicted nucleic acid-binding protein|nr:type II toxin-antitoxin system VapC family toxin [Gemmataceae bacterium]